MNKYIKYIIIILLILLIALPFAGSYSVQSVDDLAYLVTLGVDKRRNK